MRAHSLWLGASLLVACNGGDADSGVAAADDTHPIEGIWRIYLPSDVAVTCDESIEHTFVDTVEPSTETDWTYTESSEYSDGMVFVQVTYEDAGSALLMLDTLPFVGVQEGKQWVFSWVGTDDSSDSEQHVSSYAFTEEVSITEETIITLSFDGETASGTWAGSSSVSLSYSETDTWSVEVGIGSNGQIPSEDYLWRETTKGGSTFEIPYENIRDRPDCQGLCQLRVTGTCAGERPITAVRTGYHDIESYYNYLQNADRGEGTGG